MPSEAGRARVLFVNGGILGLISFYDFLEEWLTKQTALEAEHVLLSEGLTVPERIVRRLMCQRVWRDGWLGLANVDLARLRAELHTGLLARWRMPPRDLRRFDVIHFHRQATAYGSLDVMREVPSVVSIDCTQSCVLQYASSRLERKTYVPNVWIDGVVFNRAAHVIATSNWAAGSMRTMYPRCQTPVDVLPSPVQLHWFDPSWADERSARARAGAKPRVLFMGGDFPRKGGYDLLNVWRAGGFHERADLDLVTGWPIEATLPPGVRQVRGIVAHSPEWAATWQSADIFVMPTRNEAFGLVFQEAAAAGLPAIGPQLNAVPEIIRDGETGVLIPPGDIDALGRSLASLIGSSDLREKLGRQARRLIERVAAPDTYMARMIGIIEQARMRRSQS